MRSKKEEMNKEEKVKVKRKEGRGRRKEEEGERSERGVREISKERSRRLTSKHISC